MSEECDSKRGLVLVHADQSYGASGTGYEENEDAWRLYLENPLTAASKAMLSLNGEDGSNPQYFYDYYNNKVPRDKKVGGHIKTEPVDADPNKINFLLPGYPESMLTITPLRNVPLHTVTIQGGGGGDKREQECPSYPQSLTSLSTYSAVSSLEVPLHPSSSSSSYSAALEDPHRPAAGPSHHSSSQSEGGPRYIRAGGPYSPGTTTTTTTTKALTPDSTYTETYKDTPSQILSLSEDNIQLRLSSITPEDYMTSTSSGASGHQFEYIIEAPQSLKPKGSSSMSYLNKGQFYPITLRGLNTETHHPYTVRSEVMLVFGEEKFTEEQLKHWRFWQSRQHTAKQRCLDIADYKESFSTIDNIEEIAYNAVSFTWDSRNEARIFVSVHCLSTDFSPQKGVRGLPLVLQIDSYVGMAGGGERRVHRAASQVKVFCDKGAERKIRDEERKQNRRRLKGLDAANAASGRYLDATVFEPIRDLNSQPVLFIPEQKHCYSSSSSSSHRQTGPSDGTEYRVGQKRTLSSGQSAPLAKMSKTEQHTVLLYVRKEKDEVFDALMLRTPTLCGLLDAVSEKFELPTQRIGKVYRRCKNGMLVNMDDNMIRHYSNEDTFLISMDEMNMGGQVLLTLTEI